MQIGIHRWTVVAILFAGTMVIQSGCKPEEDRIRDAELQAAAKQASETTPQMPAQVAAVGVGVKGSSLNDTSKDDPRRILTGPAIAYFQTKEKIVFEIQLPKTMQLFEAEKGRYPKSHEEFWSEIINKGMIKLPALHPGMIYRYHPDDHELWVEPENPESKG